MTDIVLIALITAAPPTIAALYAAFAARQAHIEARQAKQEARDAKYVLDGPFMAALERVLAASVKLAEADPTAANKVAAAIAQQALSDHSASTSLPKI